MSHDSAFHELLLVEHVDCDALPCLDILRLVDLCQGSGADCRGASRWRRLEEEGLLEELEVNPALLLFGTPAIDELIRTQRFMNQI